VHISKKENEYFTGGYTRYSSID